MLRHFCLTREITLLTRGVFEATESAILVASACFLQGLGACAPGTIAGTVALSAVAAAANQYRYATAGAKIVSGGRFHWQ